MPLQPFGDLQRVVAMALHPQRQRLDAGLDKEGVEGRNRRTEIPQTQYPCGDGEGEVAEDLVQDDAAIFRPGLRQQRILAGFSTSERTAVDDDPAHRIAMTADELGERMDEIRAVFERPQSDRASPSYCRR